jgi:hypothetical protein
MIELWRWVNDDAKKEHLLSSMTSNILCSGLANFGESFPEVYKGLSGVDVRTAPLAEILRRHLDLDAPLYQGTLACSPLISFTTNRSFLRVSSGYVINAFFPEHTVADSLDKINDLTLLVRSDRKCEDEYTSVGPILPGKYVRTIESLQERKTFYNEYFAFSL